MEGGNHEVIGTNPDIRVVEMSPDLAEAFVDHLDRLRRAGNSTGPDDFVVQNMRGGRISRQRVAAIVREAAQLATEKRTADGLPPLPRTTPHSLRRTYISIALLANRFDVKWVVFEVSECVVVQRVDEPEGASSERCQLAGSSRGVGEGRAVDAKLRP